MAEKPRTPSIAISLLPVVTLVIMLAVAIYIFRGDSLGGASQIVLLIATSICSLIAVFHCKIKWEDIEGQIARNIYGIAPSVIILLLIGTLSGSWMVSGIVPSLIYYGLQVMQTDFFLVACCLLCSIVSVMTGSSWTTIATIGIALIGIGEAQGFSTGWVAGAIISGAYFGDKMSPLSDTTVLAASVTDTPLFTHIRYMLYTTVPSMIVTLIVFSIAGFSSGRIPDSRFLRSLKRLVPYHALAYDRTDRYRNHDRQEDTFDRGAFRLLHTRRNIRLDLPAKRLIGDFRDHR